MSKSAVVLPAFLAFLFTGIVEIRSQEWTRFRGPNGSGISEATTVPVTWTEKDYNWKIDLPGRGHSSPVVWGTRLFLTGSDSKKGERTLLCIDTADGRIRWRRVFRFKPYKKHRNNTFATTTPAVDGDRVYVLWQSAAGSVLHALDHDGKPAWRFDLGRYKSGHGTGSSPIVHGDRVIICNDHDGESFLVALDRATGKVRWKLPRIGDRACYSTPCVFDPPGRKPEIIFTHSFRGITGVDIESGRRTWEIDVFGRHKQRAVGSPVIFGDLVIGSSGFTNAEKNVVAVRPGDQESGEVKEVYRLQDRVPHVPTPLVTRDRLYLWSDRGIVSCIDARNGKQIWQERVDGSFHGSPVWVGGRIYAASWDGIVTVIDAADEFKVLARNELGEEMRSTPAVSDGVMYCRTVSRLFSIGGKPIED